MVKSAGVVDEVSPETLTLLDETTDEMKYVKPLPPVGDCVAALPLRLVSDNPAEADV